MSRKRVYLSLGSNIGERQENLDRAVARLEPAGVHVVRRSSVYETEPQDVSNQPWFLNIVVECETRCFPLQLLTAVLGIERDLGRKRGAAIRRGPRVIDIDILLYGNSTIETPRLVVPHPRMLERRFVLEPLLEIAPGLRHPATKEPFSKYLSGTKSQKVKPTLQRAP
ncbi:MAG TPA: 2-amino-4-hydroxy-6-hydroxymethyldihydropteridine diphosphokinase [Bryobacteraceae bacterium]|nr:2-amino-4-hydroxy-6-hydroxymethyldihydropteridine diphosphokinase [Bryobacteraceae bacterium]